MAAFLLPGGHKCWPLTHNPAMTNLHDILWRNEMQVLTPELIIGIEYGASTAAGTPIGNRKPLIDSLGEFVGKAGAVSFHVERLADCLEEVRLQHADQWDEIEPIRTGLNPDYERQIEMERTGAYVLFTARDSEGVLVGNTSCYLFKSIHTQRLIAKEDTMYLVPVVRKGMLAVKFFRYCEEQLIRAGAMEITVSVKTTNEAHKLWERQGYLWTDRVLTKIIEANQDV